jgi:hypothetical protein
MHDGPNPVQRHDSPKAVFVELRKAVFVIGVTKPQSAKKEEYVNTDIPSSENG